MLLVAQSALPQACYISVPIHKSQRTRVTYVNPFLHTYDRDRESEGIHRMTYGKIGGWESKYCLMVLLGYNLAAMQDHHEGTRNVRGEGRHAEGTRESF